MLSGILGSAVYDVIRICLSKAFNGDTDLIEKKVYEAIDKSCVEFFEKYKDKFGKPENSFIARRDNIETIVRSMSYGGQFCEVDDLNKNGFNQSPMVTRNAIKYFLSCLEKNICADWDLNKIKVENQHINETKESQKKIEKILEHVSKKDTEMQAHRLAHPDYPEGWTPEQYKPYGIKCENGNKLNYMVKEKWLCAEQVFANGADAYYELSSDGNCKNVKFPHDINTYEFIIPEILKVSEFEKKMPNGGTIKTTNLKWHGKLEICWDVAGKITNFEIKGSIRIDHNNRTITFVSPVFD